MKFNMKQIVTTALTTSLLASVASAHDGRRFDVQVVDDQIVAQGYISGSNPNDDGGGVVRDYYNAVHGHWENLGDTPILSRSTLPGFDIKDVPELVTEDISLTLTGVKKWADAPFSDFAGGHAAHDGHGGHGGHVGHGLVSPNFIDIPSDEAVQVRVDAVGETLALGVSFTDPSVTADEHYDLTFDYLAGDPLANAVAPDDSIYLVEFEISTSADGILPSDTINAILSPPGMSTPGSHGLSLATEQALGTPIPEPGSLAVLVAVGVPFVLRRRRAARG